MPQRFARLDVEFPFKRTAHALQEKFGPYGPLVFIYLILRAKDGSPPGTFSYPNETVGWDRLGLADQDVPFTLDEFLRFTGRIKQSSRTSNGRRMDVKLTHYGLWQKDAKRYEEAEKKRRKRAQNTGDTQRDKPGTRKGRRRGPSSSSITTPLPPNEMNGKPPDRCPICNVTMIPGRTIAEHLENVHPEHAGATP